MYSIIPVGADLGAEAYLILTPQKAALIDSGFAYCAHELIENVKNALDGRELDYIILTHTHYDHCSGSPYLVDVFPNVQIIAGTYSARVFSRPSAVKIIGMMNYAAANERGREIPEPEKLENFRCDLAMSQGDIIDLGDIKFTVYETPGHTRCSISLYCESEKLLVSSETLGLYTGIDGFVMPCFLVGYNMSIESVEKIMALDIEKILFPHMGVHEGKEIEGFFQTSLEWFKRAAEAVCHAYSSGANDEGLIRVLEDMFYPEQAAKIQPRKAFLLNATYMIPVIIRECLGIEDFDMSHDV